MKKNWLRIFFAVSLLVILSAGAAFGAVTFTEEEKENIKNSEDVAYKYWEQIELMSEKEFDNNVSFAYQLGAGVKLSDKFSLGVHYYAFGSQKIQGEEFTELITSQGSQTADSKFTYRSINPTIFTLRLGYHF